MLETEVKEYKLQLETIVLSLQNDAENEELQTLKTELEELIALTESAIAELRPVSTSGSGATVKSLTEPTKEKWSRENHPAYKAGYKAPAVAESEEPVAVQTTFSVNETVLARWKQGDGSFYNAKITSKTGSSANPVYTVLFKTDGSTQTCYGKDIRPLSNEAKKRKADHLSGSSTPTTSTPALAPNSSVISAVSTVDPKLAQQAKKEPSLVSDGPTRPAKIPRKVKAKNELEAGKSKWQDFAAKGKGKFGKKDSMFRTGESATARGKQYLHHTFYKLPAQETKNKHNRSDTDILGFAVSRFRRIRKSNAQRPDPITSRLPTRRLTGLE